jgi:hypothetical protein
MSDAEISLVEAVYDADPTVENNASQVEVMSALYIRLGYRPKKATLRTPLFFHIYVIHLHSTLPNFSSADPLEPLVPCPEPVYVLPGCYKVTKAQ